jgi:threonine synthase
MDLQQGICYGAWLSFYSFKDFALQLFPQVFAHVAKEGVPDKKFLILVSTSGITFAAKMILLGDTGSATVHGFCNQSDIPVMVLFPSEGVSAIQKCQMVTDPSPNLHVVAVKSDFDFCQVNIF